MVRKEIQPKLTPDKLKRILITPKEERARNPLTKIKQPLHTINEDPSKKIVKFLSIINPNIG